MGSNLSNKTPKEEIKTQNPIDPNPLPCSQAEAAKYLCHYAGLHLALSSKLDPALVKSGPHNHRGKRE
jgi:hypothetical protein